MAFAWKLTKVVACVLFILPLVALTHAIDLLTTRWRQKRSNQTHE